jgi:PQQ-like domain
MKYFATTFRRAFACTLFVSACALTLGLTLALAQWPQWAHDQQHTGAINVAGQNLNRVLADIVYDPFVNQEKAPENGDGDLLVHYQTPLVDGNDVYMEFKSGTYTSITTWESQTWNEKKLSWVNGQLVTQWSFQSDWKPVPFGSPVWEPVFHAVLAGGAVYVPGGGGTVYKLDKATGAVLAHFSPLDGDATTFVCGPLSADSAGNVYYNAIKFNNSNAWGKDVVSSWLVKISAGGTTSSAQFKDIAVGELGPNDPCEVGFSTPPPWPPSPTAVAPTINCGTIRPGINVAPAIGPDGTIYTIGRNHFVTRYGYLIAVNPNLTPKWTASMHGILNDGCNVQIPPNGTPGGCSVGATTGVAPDTNSLPSGRILDDSTSSPVVAPDGTIFYGSYTRYNYAQGHMLRFSSTGQFLNSYIFGWDDTPAIRSHGGTYSIVTKDNHYGGLGSYCNDDAVCPPDRNASNPGYPEQYFVTSLSPTLNVEWQYQNTNTLSCTRQPNGTVTCVSDHPSGFEWCVNAPAIDSNGITYANSEDGNLFAINPNGTLKQKIFQQLAIGAAYTPASIGSDGKLYSQNDGHLYVVGN